MNYTECIEQARGRIGSYCKACWECNGRACKNQIPVPLPWQWISMRPDCRF